MRYLNMAVELPFLEGFQDVSERFSYFSPLEGWAIPVSGDVDHWNVKATTYDFCRLDSIQFTVQHDVHQHEVGPIHFCLLNRLFAGDRGADDVIAQVLQSSLHIHGNDSFVFNDEYPYFIHGSPFRQNYDSHGLPV